MHTVTGEGIVAWWMAPQHVPSSTLNSNTQPLSNMTHFRLWNDNN